MAAHETVLSRQPYMVVAEFDNSDNALPQVEPQEVLKYYQDRKHVVRELSLRGQLWQDPFLGEFEKLIRKESPRLDICLQRLSLSNNLLSNESGESLAHIVENVHTLKELDLADNKLEADSFKKLAKTLGSEMCTLRTLNLYNNQLGSRGAKSSAKHLAYILRNNTSIHSLNLGKNQFNSKGCIDKLVEALVENVHLQHLDLSQNQMKNMRATQLAIVLDPTMSDLPLEVLNLSSNALTDKGVTEIIGAMIEGGNTKLQKLNFSNNKIGLGGARSCALCCQYSHTLQELMLSSCYIGDEGTDFLCTGLQSREFSEPSLQRLDLSWNCIHNSGALSLAQLLQVNDSVAVLNLANNGIGSAGAQALALSFQSNETLQILNLSGNQVRDFGAVKLADSLCREDCTLESLIWDNNKRMTELGRQRLEGAFRLRESRKTWLGNTLKTISTRRHLPSLRLKLGDEELICICDSLSKNRPSVPFVSFNGTSITHRGVERLAKTVLSQNCVPLKRLYLQNTQMGDRGAAAIAQALLHNENLTVLSLTSCEITEEGAIFLSNILRRNPKLQRMDLKKNRIGDRGAQELFGAICCAESAHQTMVSLNLSSNQLSDRSICTLYTFEPLVEVHLGDNDITEFGALDLAKICLKSPRLRRLHIPGNRITARGVQTLNMFIPRDIEFFESGNQSPPL